LTLFRSHRISLRQLGSQLSFLLSMFSCQTRGEIILELHLTKRTRGKEMSDQNRGESPIAVMTWTNREKTRSSCSSSGRIRAFCFSFNMYTLERKLLVAQYNYIVLLIEGSRLNMDFQCQCKEGKLQLSNGMLQIVRPLGRGNVWQIPAYTIAGISTQPGGIMGRNVVFHTPQREISSMGKISTTECFASWERYPRQATSSSDGRETHLKTDGEQ
jgi:hypothetical protein